MIEVNPIAFDAAAVVRVLDRVVGVAHAAIGLGHPGAILVFLVVVDDLEEGVLPLVRPDLFVSDDPGPEVLVVAQANLDQRPLNALARLFPQDRGRASLPAFQAGRLARENVGPVVPFLLHIDPGRGHAADAGIVGDLAGFYRLQQDGELAAMRGVLRFDPDQRWLVLERLKVGQRVDDRGDQTQDIEAVSVGATGVANLDDSAVGEPRFRPLPAALLPGLQIERSVDERVERLGWDFQLLAGLHFLERVSHAGDLRHVPMPNPEKSPFS